MKAGKWVHVVVLAGGLMSGLAFAENPTVNTATSGSTVSTITTGNTVRALTDPKEDCSSNPKDKNFDPYCGLNRTK